MSLEINLTGWRAIVTGVSSGIGAGIALALAQAGCNVAGCGLEDAHSAGAQQFLADLQAQARHGYYQAVDLADGAAARAFVEWSAARLGGIDLVVSNAGRNFNVGAAQCSDDDWNANIELNLAAHWRVAQAAKPHLDQATTPALGGVINDAIQTLYAGTGTPEDVVKTISDAAKTSD